MAIDRAAEQRGGGGARPTHPSTLRASSITAMNTDDIDIGELRKCMLLGLDFITAHYVAHTGSYDIARITAARDTLEQRVLLALTETDLSEMPEGWSWKHAAHEIAVRVAMMIVEEERSQGSA